MSTPLILFYFLP